VNQTSLNLIAITIFVLVMSSLLGPLLHLSPFVPAFAAFAILSVATVDTLSWQGKAGTLVVDWFNRFSPEHQARVVRHEAGHFLVAYLSEIPVTGYTLSAWEAFRQGLPGYGGVQFDSEALNQMVERGTLSAQWLDRYCTVLMAGIAAETLAYGNAVGGGDDRQTLRFLWSQLRRPAAEAEQKQSWAVFQAKHLIQAHQSAYEALVTAMEQRASIEACYQAISTSELGNKEQF
jgi:hypothetical protein